ncbi:MAG: sporulation initiation factor Spo0A [Clostridia bacterium]|nr:sporulation initiation factor Spo0A [Clostridia bacterium]
MCMRRIYQQIAKEDGISVAEVEREMQAAIEHIYMKNDKSERERELQQSITYKGEIPTVEEFIASMSYKIKCQARK